MPTSEEVSPWSEQQCLHIRGLSAQASKHPSSAWVPVSSLCGPCASCRAPHNITARPLLTSCSCTAGTAEDAQLFNTNYVSRGMGNLRAEVDDLLNRLLTGHLKDEVGHESKLRSLDQKAALLSALQPADRLRTLGLVCVHSQSKLHVELSVPRATLAHYGWDSPVSHSRDSYLASRNTPAHDAAGEGRQRHARQCWKAVCR